MINRFKEMIDSGIGSFNYIPLAQSTPESDTICRIYNNIFSLGSDTRMSKSVDNQGDTFYIISGSAVASPKWETKTIYEWGTGAIDYRPSGFWSISDFLFKMQLTGRKTTLNGDIVMLLKIITSDEPQNNEAGEIHSLNTNGHEVGGLGGGSNTINYKCPNCVTTINSQIPQPISKIGVKEELQKIWSEGKSLKEIAEAMSKNPWIKGENWVVANENLIVGIIGNEVYKIENKK